MQQQSQWQLCAQHNSNNDGKTVSSTAVSTKATASAIMLAQPFSTATAATMMQHQQQQLQQQNPALPATATFTTAASTTCTTAMHSQHSYNTMAVPTQQQ